MIDFHGYKIISDSIRAVGPIKTIPIGEGICSWCYGFDIFLNGNTLEIKIDERKIDDSKDKANKWRDELIDFLETNGF